MDQILNLIDKSNHLEPSIIRIISIQQTVSKLEPTESIRWINRINSLLSSNQVRLNSLGVTLALITLRQNPISIINQRDQWIQTTQTILSSNNNHSDQSFPQVLDLILHLLESKTTSSSQSSKKDPSDSKSISNLTKILIQKSDRSIQNNQIRSISIKTLSILLIKYSSILKPFGTQLESIALSNLLNLNDPSISQSATLLLTQIYRLGQKSDQSLNWSKTIKATIGSIQIILNALLSPFLTEFNHLDSNQLIQLSPLEIPPQDLIYNSTYNDFNVSTLNSEADTTSLPSNRIPVLIARIERLNHVLITILSQSTSKPVSVPLGELNELGSRLILIAKAQVHDRADLDWKFVWDSIAGTLTCRAIGCRLLAKLAHCTRYRFTPFSSQAISILSSEIDSIHQNSHQDHQRIKSDGVDGSIIHASYARIVSCCPANPDKIKTSISPIIRTILADIQLVYGKSASMIPSNGTNKPASQKSKSKRKSLGQFSDDLQAWNLSNNSTFPNHLDLQLVERALKSLKILLESVPYHFPSSYLAKSIQILLNLSTSPSFISPIYKNHSLNSKLDSTTLSSPSIIASMNNNDNFSLDSSFISRPSLRIQILNCLLTCLPIQKIHSNNQNLIGLNLAQNLLEVCSNLVKNSGVNDFHSNCNDSGLIELARFGINLIVQFVSRPRVPVIFSTEAQLNADDSQSSEDESDDLVEIEASGSAENSKKAENGEEMYDGSNRNKVSKNETRVESNNPLQESNPYEPSMNSKIDGSKPSTNTLVYSHRSSIVWSSSLVELDHFDEYKKRKYPSSHNELPPLKKNIISQSYGQSEQDKGNEEKDIHHIVIEKDLSDSDDDDQIPQIHFDHLDQDESDE